MRSRSYLFLVLVLALTGVSGWLYSVNDYKLGLDVQGGVRFTLKAINLKPEQQKDLLQVMQTTAAILEARASGLGVVESTVQIKQPDTFIVELPGFTDEKEARRSLQTSASIKFYEANTVVSPIEDSLLRRPYAKVEGDDPNDPIVKFEDRKTNEIIEPTLPDGRKNPKYLAIIQGWVEKSKLRNFENPIVEGEDLKSAGYDQAGATGYRPTMEFSATGAEKMKRWSQRNKNRQENLAAVLDNRVLSIAPLEPGAVISTNAVITGTFSTEYVVRLRDLLNSGRLPVELEETSSKLVQPTIGKQALGLMIQAGLIAFGLTALYLIAYYAFPGFVALIALGLYVLFTLTALKLMGATFSLAAIAGFILSVGMAVDANILVFERFKEEMKAGKSLATAIELGFKRALPAIVDSNACTILTSLVLANLGTGPVKGFAVTLIIGVAVSLFTALTVTRSLLMFLVGSGIGSNPKWYAVERNWFGRFEETADQKPLQIVNKSGKWFMISLITIVVGLPFVFMGGLKPNVEFQGGYEVTVALNEKSKTPAEITENLNKAGIGGSNVKLAGGGDTRAAVVTVPATNLKEEALPDVLANTLASKLGLDARSAAAGGSIHRVLPVGDPPTAYTVSLSLRGQSLAESQIVAAAGEAGLTGVTAKVIGAAETPVAMITIPLSVAKSGETVEQIVDRVAQGAGFDPAPMVLGGDVAESGKVGETVRAETIRNAILAVIISTVLIVLYLAFRFGVAFGNFVAGLRFGLSAVGALLHDVLVVVGVTAIVGYLYNWEISALFITSMLTVIGFSVHDTIVIFDRIRENLRRAHRGEDFGNLVNRSITQSFSRSINTSITVIATLVVLLIWGTSTPDLKLFTVTMLAGILSGTYSSIYNASPILYLWDKAIVKSRGVTHGFMGMAEVEAQRYRAAQLTVQAEDRDKLTKDAGGKSYGTIKRRTGVDEKKRGEIDLDDK
ncbi:MAG: protein translocase subunit SecD [Fimbriimonadaceae bacterium]